jgi:hypothetical protein
MLQLSLQRAAFASMVARLRGKCLCCPVERQRSSAHRADFRRERSGGFLGYQQRKNNGAAMPDKDADRGRLGALLEVRKVCGVPPVPAAPRLPEVPCLHVVQ